jgi:hypothetical protein
MNWLTIFAIFSLGGLFGAFVMGLLAAASKEPPSAPREERTPLIRHCSLRRD